MNEDNWQFTPSNFGPESVRVIELNKKRIILGIILVIILPYVCLFPYARWLGFDYTQPEIRQGMFLVTRILLWLLLGGMILYARKAEKSNFLLWQERPYNAGIYIAFLVVTFIALWFLLIILSLVLMKLGLKNNDAGLEKIREWMGGKPVMIVITCITAGVTEELMFRGYLQPRLELIFKSRVVGIIGSAIFFALIHFGYGTVQNIVGPLVIGAVFAIHYSYFRNLKFLIVFHILWDLFAIYLTLKMSQLQHS